MEDILSDPKVGYTKSVHYKTLLPNINLINFIKGIALRWLDLPSKNYNNDYDNISPIYESIFPIKNHKILMFR